MIQVLQRACQVLNQLAIRPEEPMALGELAQATGLNIATCARILQTLVAEGYVEQPLHKGKYSLGYRAYDLTARGVYGKDIVFAAKADVDQLVEDFNETAVISTMKDDYRVLIYQKQCSREILVNGEASLLKSFYESATGMIFLAYMEEEQRRAYVEQHDIPQGGRWPIMDDHGAVLKVLDEIKAAGFAEQKGEGDLLGLGFPLIRNGSVVAALGMYAPRYRVDEQQKQAMMVELRRASERISAQLSRSLT